MRYVSVTLEPEDGGFNPSERVIGAEPSVTRELVYNVSLFSEDRGAILTRRQGDVEVLQDILTRRPEIIDYTVSEDDSGIYEYTHFVPNDTLRQLFSLTEKYSLFVDYPLEYTDRSGVKLTLIGDAEGLRQTVDSMPEEVTETIWSTGEYRPESRRLVSRLTDRQQQVIRTAIELGYYEIPREASCADVAEHIGVSVNTVSEHLRKVHASIIPTLFPDE